MEFFLALLGIATDYLSKIHNKTANTIATDVGAIDQATLAVLKENARIKGATIDWNDPAAVSGFVATLPVFTPIPEPAPAEDSNSTKSK